MSLVETEHDLTSGSLHRNIWLLAIPMILETSVLNVSQILDTLWVGKLGSAALAAVTISITIRWMVNSLANGLGIGGMAVVARRIGERNRAAAEHAVWQTISAANRPHPWPMSPTGLILTHRRRRRSNAQSG